MKKAALKYVAAGSVVGLAVALGATGTAVADNLINSGDIKDNSVKAVDLAPNSVHGSELANYSVQWSELTTGLRDRLGNLAGPRGATGPRGPQGDKGPKGDKGEKGDVGQTLVATRITPPNPAINNLNVVAVPSVAVTSGDPTANTGVELVPAVQLAAGTYLLHAAAQFFDFDGGNVTDTDYGVVRLFLNGTPVPASVSWTPVIPDDGNNAAQSSGSIVVTVPAGGATLSARAVIRGGDDGQAGGSLIVTRIG